MAETQSLTLVPKDTGLAKIGERSVSTRGWRHSLFYQHLAEHLTLPESQKWCTVACAARFSFGRDTPSHRKMIRKRLSSAFRWLLNNGIFLAIEYEQRDGIHHGEARGMKIWEPMTTPDAQTQSAIAQLKRMKSRHEITEELLERARQLLGIP